MYRHWKRKRSIQKVKPGDGHELKAFRWWEIISRSLFYIRLVEKDGNTHTYAVNVNYFSEESTTDLYRDGKHYATSKLPATFPVADGMIEVATTAYGLKRMHYIKDGGFEQQLSPHPRSMEGLRLRFDSRFPRASRWIGIAAIVVLLLSLILGLPQLVALISQIPIISDHWGSFESPIVLPNWLNVMLIVLGILAAMERAITLRNHWLIDIQSWWDN